MALDVTRTQSGGVDVLERGKDADGNATSLDGRLFMQLLVFGDCIDIDAIRQAMLTIKSGVCVYADINDSRGVGVLFASESADTFVTEVRDLLNRPPFANLTPKPEYTMFGRTYAIGYERNLAQALIETPRKKATDPNNTWAIWYPLRRSGLFENLSSDEQRAILMEHGGIGMAYGRAGLGTDIRLASHGLDKNDNDFTIGLLGPDLAPLSKLVERMRKTKQTSQYLTSLGPFFIGKIVTKPS